uniref:Uncharacterized protein n=1 Tax=Timema douglasi TaxID=61478 RepID=A0A7R8VI29_TIMDO|nr:unnamed protein product [Timema douglasi]
MHLFLLARKDTLVGSESTPRLSPSHLPSHKIGFRLALDRAKGINCFCDKKYIYILLKDLLMKIGPVVDRNSSLSLLLTLAFICFLFLSARGIDISTTAVDGSHEYEDPTPFGKEESHLSSKSEGDNASDVSLKMEPLVSGKDKPNMHIYINGKDSPLPPLSPTPYTDVLPPRAPDRITYTWHELDVFAPGSEGRRRNWYSFMKDTKEPVPMKHILKNGKEHHLMFS